MNPISRTPRIFSTDSSFVTNAEIFEKDVSRKGEAGSPTG